MKVKFFKKAKTMFTAVVSTVVSNVQRGVAYILMGFMSCASMFAQSADNNQGISAITEVTAKVAAYVPVVQNLIYAIAGVVAVVGAIQVYMKMNNGDQDVSKSIMMLIGACLFLVAAAVALPKFFGVG